MKQSISLVAVAVDTDRVEMIPIDLANGHLLVLKKVNTALEQSGPSCLPPADSMYMVPL